VISAEKHFMKYSQGWIGAKTHLPICMQPSTQTLSVSVVDVNNVPIHDRSVTLTLIPKEGTAGHIHVGGKPAGSFATDSTTVTTKTVQTGASGTVSVYYRAPRIAGPVTFKGTSSNATTGMDTVLVGVPNLVQLLPGPNYGLTGAVAGKHMDNHWMTEEHKQQVIRLAAWFASWWKPAVFNDSSLPLGGFYDVGETPWIWPHRNHSDGLATDFGIKDTVTNVRMPTGVMNAVMLTWEAWGFKAGNEINTAQPHIHLGPKNACP
jgi:hypothetical protein